MKVQTEQKVDLEELAGGSFSENFTRVFNEVIRNMKDVNTGYKEKRGITVNLTFVQNESRDDAQMEIVIKPKLAPVKPIHTQFFIGKDINTGAVEFEEYGNRSTIKGQMSLDLKEEPEIAKEDSSEAEGPKKISDFRKVISK